MTLTVEATYEGGVLKPVTSLDLAEHQHVLINVMPLAGMGENAYPTAEIFSGSGSSVMDEAVDQTIHALRAQTAAIVEKLADAQLLPKESISLNGLWSHLDSSKLDAALAEVRSETNRKLQQLADLQ